MKTSRFHVCITVNRQEYHVITKAYLSLHLTANKTIELNTKMHQNALFWNEKNCQPSAPRFSHLRRPTAQCCSIPYNQTGCHVRHYSITDIMMR